MTNTMHIQARLYWRLLRATMDEDDYFKDFKLEDYRFIVVNNTDNPTPLVWTFSHTQSLGDFELGGNVYRDPEKIGFELSHYLKTQPKVPLGINLDAPNNIEKWFESRNNG